MPAATQLDAPALCSASAIAPSAPCGWPSEGSRRLRTVAAGVSVGRECLREQLGVAGLALGVQVSGRGLDVRVAHPGLDLNERGPVDRHRAEVVPERVEGERPEAGAPRGGQVATAKCAGVQVGEPTIPANRVAVGHEAFALAEASEVPRDLVDIGTLLTLPLLGVTSSPWE